MHCPFCKAEDTRVVDSRMAEDGAQVRRRRECEKRDGNPEPYDEQKLRKGLARALYKRPVTPEQLDHLIENVERKLRTTSERQVPSHRLGELVMLELRDLDQVAYVRFASIYHQFKDATEFRDEVDRLLAFPSAEQRRSQMSLIGGEDEKEKKKA